MKPLLQLIERLRERLHVFWYGRNTHCAMCDFYGDEEDESASVGHPPAEAREHPTEQAVAQ